MANKQHEAWRKTRQQIIKMVKAGESNAKIIEATGCSPTMLDKLSGYYSTRREKQEQRREEVIALLKAGKGPGEIIEQVGCSLSLVTHLAAAYGIKTKRSPTLDRICSAVSLLQQNVTYTDAAERVGLSENQIASIARAAQKAGLMKRRTPGRPRNG